MKLSNKFNVIVGDDVTMFQFLCQKPLSSDPSQYFTEEVACVALPNTDAAALVKCIIQTTNEHNAKKAKH